MSAREPLGTYVQYTVEVQRTDGVWVEYPGARRVPDPQEAAADAVKIAGQLGLCARVAQLVTDTYRVAPGGALRPRTTHPPDADLGGPADGMGEDNRLLFETDEWLVEEWMGGQRTARWRRVTVDGEHTDKDAALGRAQAAAADQGRRTRLVHRYTRVTVVGVVEAPADADDGGGRVL